MRGAATGGPAAGALEFLNQAPVDWLSKHQNQVEPVACRPEFMAARQATERAIGPRCTLRSLGVPLDGPPWVFGGNKPVVTSSTAPHSSLGKRWNALPRHRAREAIAGGWLRFEHIPGTENPAGALAKALAWAAMRFHIEPLLLWKGDVGDYPGSSNPEGSVTSPAHETTQENTHGVSSGTTQLSDERDPTRAGNTPAVSLLWNNQYAVLAYEDTDGED